MEVRELLNALTVAERLKDTTRHCYTSKGRHESVAEHSWMMTLMAFFMKNEFHLKLSVILYLNHCPFNIILNLHCVYNQKRP